MTTTTTFDYVTTGETLTYTPVASTDDTFPTHAVSFRAHLFGSLVKRAQEVVQSYVSDLYYDAMWLNDHVDGTNATFFYSVRQMGTTIGQNVDLVAYGAEKLYRIDIVTVEKYGSNETRYSITPIEVVEQ